MQEILKIKDLNRDIKYSNFSWQLSPKGVSGYGHQVNNWRWRSLKNCHGRQGKSFLRRLMCF